MRIGNGYKVTTYDSKGQKLSDDVWYETAESLPDDMRDAVKLLLWVPVGASVDEGYRIADNIIYVK